jgi:membrane-associated phospholipid phosphatase
VINPGHYSIIATLVIKFLLITSLSPGYSLSVSGNDAFMIYKVHDRTYKLPVIETVLNRQVVDVSDLNPLLSLSSGEGYAERSLISCCIRDNNLILAPKSGYILKKGEVAGKRNGTLNYTRSAPPDMRLLVPGIAGLAVLTFLVDEPVVNYSRDHQTSFLKSIAHYTDAGGEKKIVVPGVLLTYLTARYLVKDERLKNTTLNSIQSIIVTAIATEGIKYLAGRARPFTMEGAYSFQPFPGGVDRHKSLPSGHASLAFAVFTPFAETYSRWIYLVPASVALGRVYQDKHWLSDVVTGSGIGLISGILFTHHENIQIIPNGLRIYF